MASFAFSDLEVMGGYRQVPRPTEPDLRRWRTPDGIYLVATSAMLPPARTPPSSAGSPLLPGTRLLLCECTIQHIPEKSRKSRPVGIGIQSWPGGAPDYRSSRKAVLRAEDLGADILCGYDHFHAPAFESFVGEGPVLAKLQPDIVNFEG